MANDFSVFVDANVFLYGHDARVPSKRSAAQEWVRWCWQAQAGRISTQVLHEFFVNLRRLAPSLDIHAARRLVRSYRSWKPWLVDEATVDLAWDIQDRFQVSYWDALMLAAAQQMGCRYFLTEDLQHGQQIDAVRIVNPFLQSPSGLAA